MLCILSESHARQQATYCLLLHPQLADFYGNVFCIRLGRHKTVFVSGWKMVKEALVTQADNFVDRPYSPMVTRIYSGNSGESHKKNTQMQYFSNKAVRSTSEPHLSNFCFLFLSAGLFFSNGKVWRRQRRFAMTTLRTFGLAKESTEQSICDESQHLKDAMEKEKGQETAMSESKTHTVYCD